MKILIVGPWAWPQYEAAFLTGLHASGCDVSELSVTNFFSGIFGRIQQTIPLPGFALWRLNRAVIDAAKEQQPDLILFWRPTHIFPKTIRKIASLGIRTVSYNNDDPFGPHLHGKVPWHHHWLWFWYLRCLSDFDFNFFYRQVNCAEAKTYGALHADILMPYFLPWQDRPVNLSPADQERFATDVVFVGHYEPDGREKKIRALLDAGIKLRIWGGHYWSREVLGDLYEQLQPIIQANGDDYAKALCGSKICLAFLSKMNRDTYTRRCFEIPACGRVMLAERTTDLLKMFKEDEEACFFSSNEELVEKAHWLLENADIREQIAQAGMRRVWADGLDVESVAKQFLVKLATHNVN